MITTRQKLTRYCGSLAAVLGVHAVAILLALNWHASEPVQLPPAAMMVEMAPMPEPTPPPPPPVSQPTPPTPVEEPPLPKVVEAPKPKIAIPKPVKPKPKPQPPKPEKKPEPPKESPPEERTADTTSTKEAAPQAAKPAPQSPPSNSNALPSWQSDLLRHLAKYKKYPENARRRGLTGVVQLRFVVDSDGKVLSYDIASSSGNASLDRATMDMIRRAQPLPKPPAEVLINGSREVVAPFVYSIDKR